MKTMDTNLNSCTTTRGWFRIGVGRLLDISFMRPHQLRRHMDGRKAKGSLERCVALRYLIQERAGFCGFGLGQLFACLLHVPKWR